MTLQEIYELGIHMGMVSDPRGINAVKKVLLKRKKTYSEISEKKKNFFDLESLKNPYADSRILYGEPSLPVKTVLAGIDCNSSEVLLMDRLNQKGRGIGLLIGHHPEGHALASLYDVMNLQIDVYAKAGVPENVAWGIMEERMGQIKRRLLPRNHNQTVDAAKLLETPYLVLHTVWDNLGDQFMRQYISKRTFDTVGEVLDYVCEVPEYQEAMRGKAGPQIVSGSRRSRPGKIIIDFTGGTSPSKKMYIEWAKAGIGTMIAMHIPEDSLEELQKLHVNVIDAGHMASDAIGANLFLDRLETEGIQVIPCSGLIRVKRTTRAKGRNI